MKGIDIKPQLSPQSRKIRSPQPYRMGTGLDLRAKEHSERKKPRRNTLFRKIRQVFSLITLSPKLGAFLLVAVVASFGIYYWQYNRADYSYRETLNKMEQGQFEEASQELKQIVKENENNVEALEKLAVSDYNLGHHDDAIESYEKAIDKNQNNFAAFNGLGNVYRDKREFDKAEEQYKKAIELNINFTVAYTNLAIMLMDQGKKEEASRVVEEGLKHNNGDEQLTRLKGILGG